MRTNGTTWRSGLAPSGVAPNANRRLTSNMEWTYSDVSDLSASSATFGIIDIFDTFPRGAYQGAAECAPEIFKLPEHNSLPNPPQRVKVKVQVVQRVKGA